MSSIARSLLFVPGDRPERFEKAVLSGAHAVVIDLEDAVAPAAKQQARQAIADWLKNGGRAMVRVNAADTPWYEDDIQMVQSLPGVGAMLPMACEESLTRTVEALSGRPVIGLLETVEGYINLRALCAVQGLERIAFGSLDFCTESGIEDEDDALTVVRTNIVLESCYAGLKPPVDGVSTEFSDPQGMHSDALRSKRLGFGGKLCIHPRQVEAVNAAYRPTQREYEWAQRVMAAFTESEGAATAVDGKMIDKPVVDHAQRIIADFPYRSPDDG